MPLSEDFFTKHIEKVSGVSKCSFDVGDGKKCGVKVANKSAKRHFERSHPDYEKDAVSVSHSL